MRVIGVIDLLGGLAVHARAGPRTSYVPVHTVAGAAIEPGDALSLARIYLDRLGVAELYIADLDAISDRTSAPPGVVFTPSSGRQQPLLRRLAALGAPVWLDAGVASAADARAALSAGAGRVIVGLETLPSYEALDDICARVGGDRVAFSLDLRDGRPIVAKNGVPENEPVHAIAKRSADAGVGAIIVLDLGGVGTGRGFDLALIARVREAAAGVTLLAGGGARGLHDLVQLADEGCDGALVATALHDGRIGAADVASAQGFAQSRSTR